jgi:hypothetical protein
MLINGQASREGAAMSATGAETYDDEAFSFALEAAEYERFSQVAPTLGELWPAACP